MKELLLSKVGVAAVTLVVVIVLLRPACSEVVAAIVGFGLI